MTARVFINIKTTLIIIIPFVTTYLYESAFSQLQIIKTNIEIAIHNKL
jgi:hypothetical protein